MPISQHRKFCLRTSVIGLFYIRWSMFQRERCLQFVKSKLQSGVYAVISVNCFSIPKLLPNYSVQSVSMVVGHLETSQLLTTSTWTICKILQHQIMWRIGRGHVVIWTVFLRRNDKGLFLIIKTALKPPAIKNQDYILLVSSTFIYVYIFWSLISIGNKFYFIYD